MWTDEGKVYSSGRGEGGQLGHGGDEDEHGPRLIYQDYRIEKV